MRRGQFILDFGQNVREARTECGWTQEDLAYESGLHRTMVGHIEQGTRNPTLETVEKLAKALGVQPSELMPKLALNASRRRR